MERGSKIRSLISNVGARFGGAANWEEFTEWQWVTVRDQPPTFPF